MLDICSNHQTGKSKKVKNNKWLSHSKHWKVLGENDHDNPSNFPSNNPPKVSGGKLGKLVSKLVYKLCRGRIQTTYLGIYHQITEYQQDIPVPLLALTLPCWDSRIPHGGVAAGLHRGRTRSAADGRLGSATARCVPHGEGCQEVPLSEEMTESGKFGLHTMNFNHLVVVYQVVVCGR